MSRIARGRLTLDLETVDFHRVIRDCVEICRDEIFLAGLEVVLDLSARDHHVTATTRLMQVVWNLIRNAARFTPGGGTLTIRTSNIPARRKGCGPATPARHQRLIVEFADTGIGIDKAILDRIFDAFYQGDADLRRRSGGLGLGLAISRSITEAHGGRLSAKSPGPGQGSTFRLELGTVAAEATTSPEPIGPPTNPPGRSGLNVLLVEDNKDTRRYLTLVLQQRNHKVVPVDRVSAALAAAGEASFDLLISDIELPDGTGLELMHGLGGGRTFPASPSAASAPRKTCRSARAGFAEHLTKPIDLNRLESAIRRVTAHHATRSNSGDQFSPEDDAR